MHKYNVLVTRVIDGDSIVGEVKTHIMDVQIILPDVYFRLLGIDTPEIRGEGKEAGFAARDYLTSLIEGQNVVIESDEKDKYGRQLATVYYRGININRHMIDEGFAVPYED